MLHARHSSPTDFITSLPISHKSEDIWFLPFNSFSVSKKRFKKDSTLLRTDFDVCKHIKCQTEQKFSWWVHLLLYYMCNVTADLGLQRLFAAGKAENVIIALCPEITCSISLNHLMTVWPIDLHHSFANNVCYLQALGKLLLSYYSPFSCCCHHSTWWYPTAKFRKPVNWL